MSGGTRWERRRYSFWAPLYDLVVGPLRGARRRSVGRLRLTDGERLLLVGAGTGEDLPFIRDGVFTIATDLTPAMLRRARDKGRAGHHLVVMDGHSLAIRDGVFDAVALHLILAVIPDPARCLAEAVRVLRPGGRITILDKFVPDGHAASMGRRILNGITALVATDITRRLDVIIMESGAAVERTGREPAMRGLFTIATLVAAKGTRGAP